MYSSIINLCYEPIKYMDIIAVNTYYSLSNIPDLNTIVTTISDNFSNSFNTSLNEINNDNIILNNLTAIIVTILLTFVLLLQSINYYYYDTNRIYELHKMKIEENTLLFNENKNKNKNVIENVTENSDNVKTNDISNDISNDKLYIYSLSEIQNQNDAIVSKIKLNNNYIMFLRVKMKYYLDMNKTKYQLHNKNNKKNNYNDFITKDVFMIIGITFDDLHQNKTKNVNVIITEHLNYLNSISHEIYKTDDFVIIAIANTNTNSDIKQIKIINNNKITDDITNGFNKINYELFNMKDVAFNFKNSKNEMVALKYTLTLPIHDVYNMILDICNNSIFKSKLYSIDDNNNEKWNNIPFNQIKIW